ncbi:MAG: carbonic anhydrase [Coriobacteriia bacterium]|nr:carbonic anhydrase [Coriobacteriia bacterium]
MAENDSNASELALQKLVTGNKAFVESTTNPADISYERTTEVAHNGQRPYAIVVTCSDSRVPPEHVFSAGVGDLFVVRTAGNVIGDFERGSIEYAVGQLGVSLVVIMGHSQCGAVASALAGRASGYLDTVISEIQSGISDTTSEHEAILSNIAHSQQCAMQSEAVRSLVEAGQLKVIGAVYDLQTRQVKFLPGD